MLGQEFSARRPYDLHRFLASSGPVECHERGQALRMVKVQVCQKDRFDLGRCESGQSELTDDAITAIDEIRAAVDHEQTRRL